MKKDGKIMDGRIHSIESMGLVDGPGIRTVVFLKGCALRCTYCHNPDTWTMEGATIMSPEDIYKKVSRFKPYFESSGGGITFSGGDPLLQPEFLIETLKLCKDGGIHTTIDTSGYGVGRYEEILKYTDLVMLDIKHVTKEGYIDLTGQNGDEAYKFLEACQSCGTKLWIRHVVVPGITDSIEHLDALIDIIKGIKNVEKVELLPYHTLAMDKYKGLGMKYKLDGIEPMDKDKCKELEQYVLSKIC